MLALVSSDAPEDNAEALDCGADAFVVKPYHRGELLAQIRALLRRIPADEAAIQIFDLQIGLQDRAVKRAGLTINLTPRECELLHFLACNRGRVVTRAEIWAHLSGAEKESNSNIVAVLIRSLRNKIEKGFDMPLILTCWGQGYRLRGDSESEAAG